MTNEKAKLTPVEKAQKQLATREARLVKQTEKAVKASEKIGSSFETQMSMFGRKLYSDMDNDVYSAMCDMRSTSQDIERTKRDLVYAEKQQAIKTAKIITKALQEQADLGLRMTCQICGRDIQSNRGYVSHHGYQRPGHGYQTNSCEGALHLPIEASTSELATYIVGLQLGLQNMENTREMTANEEISIHLSYEVRIKNPEDRFARDTKLVTLRVTRDTYESVKEEHKNYFITYRLNSFDKIKENELSSQDRDIRMQRDYLVWQQGRMEAAQKAGVTHKFNANTGRWEAM